MVMVGGACLAYLGLLRGCGVSHRAKEDTLMRGEL